MEKYDLTIEQQWGCEVPGKESEGDYSANEKAGAGTGAQRSVLFALERVDHLGGTVFCKASSLM